MPRFTSRTLVALAFTLVVWASAFAGIRAGLRAYSPANLAILRFLVASLVLAIYAGIAHFRRPELRDIPGLRFDRRHRNLFLQPGAQLWRDSRDGGRGQPADCLHSDLDGARGALLAARETDCRSDGAECSSASLESR